MTSKNYKEDFVARVRFVDRLGNPVSAADCDFTARFVSGPTEYIAGRFDGELVNCEIAEDGAVLVSFDNHGLLPCPNLQCEAKFLIPDTSMPDGIREVSCNFPTGICLTVESSDIPTAAEVDALLPVINGNGSSPATKINKSEGNGDSIRVITHKLPKMGGCWYTAFVTSGFWSDMEYIFPVVLPRGFIKFLAQGSVGSVYKIPFKIYEDGSIKVGASARHGISLKSIKGIELECESNCAYVKITEGYEPFSNRLSKRFAVVAAQVSPESVNVKKLKPFANPIVRFDNAKSRWMIKEMPVNAKLDSVQPPTIEHVRSAIYSVEHSDESRWANPKSWFYYMGYGNLYLQLQWRRICYVNDYNGDGKCVKRWSNGAGLHGKFGRRFPSRVFRARIVKCPDQRKNNKKRMKNIKTTLKSEWVYCGYSPGIHREYSRVCILN